MNLDLLFFCNACREKSPEELAELRCEIDHSIKRYKKGEHIAYQNDKVSHLYILSKGKVKTEIVSDSGLTLSVEELSAPRPLAPAFLFANNNRFPVDVVALEDCEVILIRKDIIEQQMARCPEFMRGFLAFNANRMQFLSERLKIFSQKSIKSKIAYYILQRAKNGEFNLGRSISSLSEYFGVERPSLSRAMSELVSDGVIEYARGKGKIIDSNKIKGLL